MADQKEDRKAQLDQLLKRRDAAKEQVQRIRGRLEAAKKDVATVEKECRDRGVEPDQLEAAIKQLQERYDKSVAELGKQIDKAEQSIKPFLEE